MSTREYAICLCSHKPKLRLKEKNLRGLKEMLKLLKYGEKVPAMNYTIPLGPHVRFPVRYNSLYVLAWWMR